MPRSALPDAIALSHAVLWREYVTAPVERGMSASLIKGQHALRALKRDEQPEDLAEPVFFLVSLDANFMSGQMLVVDGGKIKC
jgi:NAD(P)-dependent dehydrogenase (short-subunit alcohol dehydrogenase family)